jgi:hypothetical protein
MDMPAYPLLRNDSIAALTIAERLSCLRLSRRLRLGAVMRRRRHGYARGKRRRETLGHIRSPSPADAFHSHSPQATQGVLNNGRIDRSSLLLASEKYRNPSVHFY